MRMQVEVLEDIEPDGTIDGGFYGEDRKLNPKGAVYFGDREVTFQSPVDDEGYVYQTTLVFDDQDEMEAFGRGFNQNNSIKFPVVNAK